jgi:hypothetical protein
MYLNFQNNIFTINRLLIFFFLCVGSMLGLCVPGCVAEEDDDLCGDVSVVLHVVLLVGSQFSAETHFQELKYIIYM